MFIERRLTGLIRALKFRPRALAILSALLLLGGLGGLAGVSVASKRRRKSATA